VGWFARHRRLLDLYRSGGRWAIERDGRPVADLARPQFVEMFWYSWAVEPTAADPAERAAVLTPEYWAPGLITRTEFRSHDFGHVASAWWAGGGLRDGRLTVRGLYLPEPAGRWDRFVLWVLFQLGY
jgi:hypothetical protein